MAASRSVFARAARDRLGVSIFSLTLSVLRRVIPVPGVPVVPGSPTRFPLRDSSGLRFERINEENEGGASGSKDGWRLVSSKFGRFVNGSLFSGGVALTLLALPFRSG